jgi:pentatricopeptide repeat protein
MQERDGIDPDYATVISGWCKSGRIEDAAKVFDEMLARAVLKNTRVLLLDEASRVQDTVGRMLQRRARQRRAGRTHAVREELQCSGCGRIRTGAAGLRVENVGGC